MAPNKYYYHLHSFRKPLTGDFGHKKYHDVVKKYLEKPTPVHAHAVNFANDLIKKNIQIEDDYRVGFNDIRRYTDCGIKEILNWKWFCQHEENLIKKLSIREIELYKNFEIIPGNRPFELLKNGFRRYHIEFPFDFWEKHHIN